MGLPSTKVCHGASNIFPLRKDQSRVHKENCGKVIRIKNDFFLNPEFWTRLYLRRIKGDARYSHHIMLFILFIETENV